MISFDVNNFIEDTIFNSKGQR